jgi:hypothetical protein
MTPEKGASPKNSREQLDAMADRELDAAVAEVVMGFHRWNGKR